MLVVYSDINDHISSFETKSILGGMYFVSSKQEINKVNVRNKKSQKEKNIDLCLEGRGGVYRDALFIYLFLKSIIPPSAGNKRVDCQLCLISQRSHTRPGS